MWHIVKLKKKFSTQNQSKENLSNNDGELTRSSRCACFKDSLRETNARVSENKSLIGAATAKKDHGHYAAGLRRHSHR